MTVYIVTAVRQQVFARLEDARSAMLEYFDRRSGWAESSVLSLIREAYTIRKDIIEWDGVNNVDLYDPYRSWGGEVICSMYPAKVVD